MRRATFVLLAVLPAALWSRLLSADQESFPPPPPISELMSETITPAEPPEQDAPPDAGPESPPAKRPALPARVWIRIKQEAGRYVADAAGIVIAPAKWDSTDWKKAVGATLIVGGLFAADESIDHAFRKNRSSFTDRVSSDTTSIGGSRGSSSRRP